MIDADLEETDTIIDLIGYVGLVLLCLRIFPPIIYNIYHRQKIDTKSSLLVIEFLGCICYITHSFYYEIKIMSISNSIVFISVISVIFYNGCSCYRKKNNIARVVPSSDVDEETVS